MDQFPTIPRRAARSAPYYKNNGQADERQVLQYERRRQLAQNDAVHVRGLLNRPRGWAVYTQPFFEAMQQAGARGLLPPTSAYGTPSSLSSPYPSPQRNVEQGRGTLRSVLEALRVGQSIGIILSGWDVETCDYLFRPQEVGDETYVFYVWISISEEISRMTGAHTAIRAYKYNSVYVLGHQISQGFVETENDEYSDLFFSLDLPIIVTKIVQANVVGPGRSSKRRRSQFAAGFRNIFCNELSSTRQYLFFPSTYSNDCFIECLSYYLSGTRRGREPHFPYQTSLTILEHARSFLKNGKGISTMAINKLNRLFSVGVFGNVKFAVHLYSKRLDGQAGYRFAQVNKPYEGIHIMNILKVNMKGEIFTYHHQKENESDDKPNQDLYHYCLFNVPFPLHGQDEQYIQSIEQEISQHIQRKGRNPQSMVGLEELHQVNAEKYKERERKDQRRMTFLKNKKKKQRPSPYSPEDMFVCVMDIESMFCNLNEEVTAEFIQAVQDFEDEHHETLSTSKTLFERTGRKHIPYFISYAFVQLPHILREEAIPLSTVMSDEDADRAHDHIVDEREMISGTNAVEDFFRAVFAEMYLRGKKKLYMFAHNMTGYDGTLLTCFLPSSEIKVTKTLKTSRGMLSIQFEYDDMVIFTRCTKAHIATSLEEFGPAMNIPKQYYKKPYDWENDYLTIEKWNESTQEFKDKLYEYAKTDISCLALCLYQLEIEFQKSFPFPHDHLRVLPRTTACTLQSYIRKLLNDRYFTSPFIGNEIIEYDELLLRSLRGGTVQSTTRLYESPFFSIVSLIEQFGEETSQCSLEAVACVLEKRNQSTFLSYSLSSPDCNSLYPTRMHTKPVPKGPGMYLSSDLANEVVHQSFPRIKAELEAGNLTYDYGYWGICSVRIHRLPKDVLFPLLSYRTKNGLLYSHLLPSELPEQILLELEPGAREDAEQNQHFMTTDDIFALLLLGGVELSILEMIEWTGEHLSHEYQPFIETCYQDRLRHKAEGNQIAQLTDKLKMNGAFGSSGVRLCTEQHEILEREENGNVLIPSKYDGVAHYNAMYPIQQGDRFIVRLKAFEGHAFSELSCKSTVTNSVLSGSRFHMIATMHYLSTSMGKDLKYFFNYILTYMDTDSIYNPSSVYNRMQALGLIHEHALGKFSPDYEGYMLRMFAPCPKVRHMTFLRNVLSDPKDKTSPKVWKIVTESKLKGLPMTKKKNGETIDILDRAQIFKNMETHWQVSEEKEQWTRSFLSGVVTGKTNYSMKVQAVMGNKDGCQFFMDKSGNILQKMYPTGYQNPSTDFTELLDYYDYIGEPIHYKDYTTTSLPSLSMEEYFKCKSSDEFNDKVDQLHSECLSAYSELKAKHGSQ